MQKTEMKENSANVAPREYQEVIMDIILRNGPPWGFAIGGGREFGSKLVINKISENGKAAASGKLKQNDELVAVNGINCSSRSDAIRVIKASNDQLLLKVVRKIATYESKRRKGENHEKQPQNSYDTVYEEMLENIDTLSTSYSGRKTYIKEEEENNRVPSVGNGSRNPKRSSLGTMQVKPNQEKGSKRGDTGGNAKENVSPNRIYLSDNQELTLNIDIKTGELWARPDGEQNTSGGSNLEAESPQRTSSPSVQKVTVKSVNVTAVHPKPRDGHLKVMPGEGHVRSGSVDPAAHSRSQDGPHSLRSLPRSSGSVDSIPLQVSMSGGPPHRVADTVGDRKMSGDQGPLGDSGVESTSNMNVRKAKAMFEEISRSTENLLDIGKSAPAPSRQRQTRKQDSIEKKDVTYTETNNNYSKRAPVTEPQISSVQTNLDNSGSPDLKQPSLINRFTSMVPQHSHSRSLPVEYEERQDSTNLAPSRSTDPSRRPRSAHYLTDVPVTDPRTARRVSPETQYNQAQLMRSFRVSKSQGRVDYGSGYDGDAESDPGCERYRQPSTRRSIEELGYIPVTVSSGMGIRAGVPPDGVIRSSTLPANEMREAAKRYHEQLLRSHPSSYRYSMGQPVDQPRLKRSSSFGSRSQSGGSVSADELPPPESETDKNSAEADNVFKVEGSEIQNAGGIQLPQVVPREDSSNSILSRLLREHSANNSGIVLSKIDEETQAHRAARKPVTVKAADIEATPAVAETTSDLGKIGHDYQSSDRRVDRGVTVKTVAVSSTTTQSTNVGSNGTGERGSEYVQGVRKSSFDRYDLEQRSRAYQIDRSVDRAAPPRLDDFVGSAVRRQASRDAENQYLQQSAPVSIVKQGTEPLILDFDRSPKSDRKGFGYYPESPLAREEAPSEDQVTIAHDKEPSTDSVKELREIEEASREPIDGQGGIFDGQAQDIESLPPPPDELLADSPPEREKPQRTINRKKRDVQTIQSSSRNSSCVSTDSTASTATADSGIGIRPFRSTDSSPRTSPLADNHSGYDYGEEKSGQAFKGSQEISDEDEGMPADPPDATSTPERTDSSYTELKVAPDEDHGRGASPTITDTPGSSAPNSRRGSATFMSPKFEELDSEKSKLIESMREKIRELKQQELEITEEIKTNEVLGNRVRCMIEARAKQTEFAKYELFIGELNNIVALLLSLTQRLHRYELMLQDLDISEEEDKNKRDELIRKIDKLKNQHEEACRLRDVNDRRGENVANFLEKYCTEEEYADFQYYVDMKSQLALMQSEIKEKVKLGEERLKALECTGVEWTS